MIFQVLYCKRKVLSARMKGPGSEMCLWMDARFHMEEAEPELATRSKTMAELTKQLMDRGYRIEEVNLTIPKGKVNNRYLLTARNV